MSSNLEIEKICVWCKEKFIAKTTSTKYCSHGCNSKAYKAQKRFEKEKEANRQVFFEIQEQSITELNDKVFLKVDEVSVLLGLCRQTIYNLIYNGQLKASRISNRITLIKRSDIDEMFNKAMSNRPNPVEVVKKKLELYSVSEIKKKFNIKNSWVYKILRENNIPKVVKNGKSYYSKQHIDNYFKKKGFFDNKEITEWKTIDELCTEFDITKTSVYSFASRNYIPKRKTGKTILYSKKHFYIAKGIEKQAEPLFYSSEEAMQKFNLTRESLYAILRTRKISKIKQGRYIKISKPELDNILKPH